MFDKKEMFTKLNLIGEGSYGKVYLIKDNIDEKYYALKKIDLNLMNEEEKNKATNEVKILQKLDCPYIIKLKNFYYEKNENLCIIMEFADG